MVKEKVKELLKHLDWLVVLHQQGSFSKAAVSLGVSKASMSQYVTDLEKAAGITLVKRAARRASLTDAGWQLLESTPGAFEQNTTGYLDAGDLAAATKGLLRVTAPVAFARQQLIPRLPDFLQLYPQIRLELDMSDWVRPLARELFDIAIRHTSAPSETHFTWTLAATRAVLVASRAYLRSRGVPEAPQALVNHACLHHPWRQGTATWTFVPSTFESGETHVDPVEVSVTGPLAANNSEALRDAAIEDLGIALLPDYSVQSALETGRLIEVLPQWRSIGAFGNWIYAIRPYSAHASRVSQVFVDYLRETFSDGFTSTPRARV